MTLNLRKSYNLHKQTAAMIMQTVPNCLSTTEVYYNNNIISEFDSPDVKLLPIIALRNTMGVCPMARKQTTSGHG